MSDAAAEGLCARCGHRDEVVTSRGSRFVLCELSRLDDRFARYPRLPVLTCAGFTARGGSGPVRRASTGRRDGTGSS